MRKYYWLKRSEVAINFILFFVINTKNFPKLTNFLLQFLQPKKYYFLRSGKSDCDPPKRPLQIIIKDLQIYNKIRNSNVCSFF